MSVNLGLTVKEFVHGEFGKINFSSHCNRKMNYERVSVVWQPPGGGEGRGDSAYESCGDARRLALIGV